jgi:hypothetical protein
MEKLSEYQKGQRYIKALKGALDSNMKNTFKSLIKEKTRKYYIYVFRGDDFSFGKFIRLLTAGINKFNLGGVK